jgi:hypothetical protein
LKEVLHHQNARRGGFACAHEHGEGACRSITLHSIEVNIENEDVYMVLLMNLPPSFDNLVTSLESMSTKDVDLQFIVARLLHEVSKRKESESKENATLLKKTHKANEKL